MFVKPSFSVVLGGLLTVALVLVLVPGPDVWWAQLAPVDYAVHRLEKTRGFVAGLTSGGQKFGQVTSWRLIFSSAHADSLFQVVFTRGTASARVYALVGLQRLHSPRFFDFRSIVRVDTTTIEAYDPCHRFDRRWIRSLSTIDDAQLRTWGDLLAHDPDSTSFARCAA